MFSGGGLSWAEAQMKEGIFRIDAAPTGTVPALTGLSCRWANMPTRHGTILSLVVTGVPGSDKEAVRRVFREVIAIVESLDRGGHPAPATGMELGWALHAAKLEGHVNHGAGSLGAARRRAVLASLVYWILHRTGIKLGGFDARFYARVVSANADFRKLDDGLKMTIDCGDTTQGRLMAVLDEGAAYGLVRYGIATQNEAMMTCIVPSIMTNDHLHFVDGASGGYTKAATMMKRR